MSLHPVAATLLVASSLTLLAAPTVAPQAAATQRTANLAGLVIDTGEEVKRICVRFEEESIDGLELIRRSGVEHEFARFSGQGTGVCSLCGTGCPSSDCFCDQSRFWNYATGDEGSWQRSPVGAERRTVAHGGVDGWAWGGQGTTPPPARFETICEAELRAASEPPPASPSPPPPPASPTTSPAPPAEPPPTEPTPAEPAPPATTPPTAPGGPTEGEADPGEPTPAEPPPSEPTPAEPTPGAPPTSRSTPAEEPAPSPTPGTTPTAPPVAVDEDDGGGGGAGPLVGFGVLLALLGGGLVALRRQRS